MILRVAITILLLGLVFGGYYGWKMREADEKAKLIAAYKPPPVTISTAIAGTAAWQQDITTTGTLRAEKSVTLDAQAAGVLTEVLFESGQHVKAGEVLAKIDDLSERAELEGAKAALNLAESNLNRKRKLLRKKLVPQSDVDELEEQVQDGKSKIERIQDLIEHKELKAPFAGTLGLRDIEVGAYMSVGSPVVSIHSLDSMRLRFVVPERFLSLIEMGRRVEFLLDTYPDKVFKARIIAKDVALSDSNRSLEVEAQVDSSDEALIPGMYATVKVPIGEEESAVVVPLPALVFSLYGDSVFVVKDKDGGKVVNRRTVKVGLRKDGQVQILEGLKQGETVVVAGQGKLREGAAVKIDNSVVLSGHTQQKG